MRYLIFNTALNHGRSCHEASNKKRRILIDCPRFSTYFAIFYNIFKFPTKWTGTFLQQVKVPIASSSRGPKLLLIRDIQWLVIW